MNPTTDKIELSEWQHDLMVDALEGKPGYTISKVPRAAGKSTIAAFLTHYDAHVFVRNERHANRLMEYGALEEFVHIFDRSMGFDVGGVVVFDDVEPPEEWLETLSGILTIYLTSTQVSRVCADGPCGSDVCAALRETTVKQLTAEQDFIWDEETKTLTYGEQKFSWMPEWKLPDWATGRVFYFSTLGSPEALNKTRFDEANKNRIAGSLVGAPLNENHKRYDLSGQNIIIDTEVNGERLEGICYVEDSLLLSEYDTGNVVGCSIDYKDRNYDKTADYDVEGAFGLGLAWVTKPFICGYPDSLVHEATKFPEDMNIEQKTMACSETGSVMDFVDKELLKSRTVVFQGYVGGGTCERAMKMLEYLGSVNDEPIKVILNSGGGSVFSGLLVFDTIKQLTDAGIEVTCEARGLAASMGNIIIQAGTHRVATPNTRFLIHEVSSWSWGKTSEMEEELLEIKKVNNMLKAIIADRTGKTMEEIESIWHKRDVWFSAEEAKEFGLIDEIIEGTKTQTQDELAILESHFAWLNSIEMRLDGMRIQSASEVFKRMEKEEEEEDEDDEDDKAKGLLGGMGTALEAQAMLYYELSLEEWNGFSDAEKLDGIANMKLALDGGDDPGKVVAPPSGKNTLFLMPKDECFAFIEDGGDIEDGITTPHNLKHLQFRTEDGYDAVLLLEAMATLEQMIFNGEISKSASEAAKFMLIEGFNALNLKIPEWATRPDVDVQSSRLSPKFRTQLRTLWNDRADSSRRFHRDRLRRQLGFDPGPVADVSDRAGKIKRSE